LRLRSRLWHCRTAIIVELCEQLFSSPISTSTIDEILATASDALAEPYAEARRRGLIPDP
jgi:hypothetical protein